MAPELIRGMPPTVQSDIWALGILLFEMIVGRRPFTGATPYELASNILINQRTRMESMIRGPIRDVTERCLCLDPAGRYGSAAELGCALRALRRRPLSGVENEARLSV
jgi:serine/threonine-protein kinase